MIVIIIARLFTLQVISSKYKILADDQGKFRKVIYPDRGIVYDRKDRPILQNTTIYDLMVIPSKLKGIDTFSICRILNIDSAQFTKKIIECIIKNSKLRPSVFEALLSDEKMARLNEAMYKFAPGFYLQERPVRSYPYDAAGNVLGYLSEVDSNFLKSHMDEGYQIGDYAGKTGLERTYERVLMGQRGIEYWKRDNKNRLTERLEKGKYDTAAIAGQNMHLSMDIELQELGEKLMQNKVGAIVAIDPRTGGILAMVSSPTYRPRYLTGSERKKHYVELLLNPALPLMNRAIGGTYSPGSTFKTLQGLIGLQENVITTSSTVSCGGAYFGCGRRMGCHAAGTFNLSGAIAHSCNTYFEVIFRRILEQSKYPDIDSALNKWSRYINEFGLGHKLGIDLPSEKRGLIPNADYYNKYRGKGKWNSCGIVSVSIGQGEVGATMLQLANAITIMANKGYYFTPHMVDSIEGGDKFNLLAPYHVKHQPINIPDSMFEAIHEGMEQVILNGTARREKIEGIRMCGKTGTVENSYKGVKQKDHAFFAAFAPREDPRIAIAVMCENAGFGATSAAPIASLMVEKYLKDSITDPKRKEKIEVVSKLNLIPQRIYKELRTQDSLLHAKDSAYLVAKGYIRIIKDTMGLDEQDEEDALEKLKKDKEAGKKSVPANNNIPAKNSIDAILPDEKKNTRDTSGLNR